jgi:hypothetical protein
VTGFLVLSDLEPAAQEAVVTALADWAEQSGDPGPLERALAGGDLLGGREPAHVPPEIRDRIGQALTAAIHDDHPDRG